MRESPHLRVLFFCLAWSACDSQTSALIEITGPMPMRTLALEATLPGHHVQKTLINDSSLTLPASVLLLLPDVAVTVEVSLTGIEAGGRAGDAQTSFASLPHSQRKLTMTLVGPGDDLAMPSDLAGLDFAGEDLASGDLSSENGDLANADLAGAPVLSLLAGLPGGHATFDGTGKDARLADPTTPVLIGSTLYVAELFSGILR